MGTEKTRVSKINWLGAYIRHFFDKRPHDSISREALCSEFTLYFGSTARTFKEIIDMFEGNGMISVQGDKIVKGRKTIQERLFSEG